MILNYGGVNLIKANLLIYIFDVILYGSIKRCQVVLIKVTNKTPTRMWSIGK